MTWIGWGVAALLATFTIVELLTVLVPSWLLLPMAFVLGLVMVSAAHHLWDAWYENADADADDRDEGSDGRR